MKLLGIEEVEYLHHNKGVENERKVPRVNSRLTKNILVVNIPINVS